jgi:hypothetical protein
MTNRGLLELAAKAAEYKISDLEFKGEQGVFVLGMGEWNPLVNDGDALRLAVKLGISIKFDHKKGYVIAKSAIGIGYKDDPYAATRRAIVRAAAAIGEQMK